MPNACFHTHNPRGTNCRKAQSKYHIPTGGPFVALKTDKKYKVVYFKYGSDSTYNVTFVQPNTWSCSCPDFTHQQRAANRTCCKHIQACIDKVFQNNRGLWLYETFLNKQVLEF